MLLNKTAQNEKIKSLKEMLNKCNFKLGVDKTDYNSIYNYDFSNADKYHYTLPNSLNKLNKKTNYELGGDILKDHDTKTAYQQYFTYDKNNIDVVKVDEVGAKKELTLK